MAHDEQQEKRLRIRLLEVADCAAILAMQEESFPGMVPWTAAEFRELVEGFAEGQVGIELDGVLVAASCAIIVTGEDWSDPHTYAEVCPPGDPLANHEPDGDTLYGLEIMVSPVHRGMRLSRRLYGRRKSIIRRHNLRRMMFGGRMPGYHRYADTMSAEAYLQAAQRKELVDPTLTAQRANGFAVVSLLPGYMPDDVESHGNAVLSEWINPGWVPSDPRWRRRARVGAVQYRMRRVDSYEAFAEQCGFFAEVAAEYRCDFLLYPELLTNQLLPLVPAPRPGLAARRLDEFTARYVETFSKLALSTNVNIIAGTHLVVEDGRLYNVAYLFHRDGRVDKQYKLHITPFEEKWWGVSGGDRLHVFDTDRGRVAILICYDVEFPELARIAKARGAQILFVPYNTDLRSAHVRVRTCAHARCIENNVYVVLSGACGNLRNQDGSNVHYARSAILTPSDIPFSRDGVGAEANDNDESFVVHEVDFALLRKMQRQGSVRTWTDRRHDLYELRSDDELIR